MYIDLFNQNKIDTLEAKILELEDIIASLEKENEYLLERIEMRDDLLDSIENKLPDLMRERSKFTNRF